jgi:hypothetical protein
LDRAFEHFMLSSLGAPSRLHPFHRLNRNEPLMNQQSRNTMPLLDGNTLGDLIHAYARARWGGGGESADDIGVRLGRDLRHRIDVLGSDAERLLTADPADVLTRLEALEKEAMLEDASASSRAVKVHARGEVSAGDPGKAPTRDHRARFGKSRESAGPVGRRRRPQRG